VTDAIPFPKDPTVILWSFAERNSTWMSTFGLLELQSVYGFVLDVDSLPSIACFDCRLEETTGKSDRNLGIRNESERSWVLLL
jgi:hypothetical protein